MDEDPIAERNHGQGAPERPSPAESAYARVTPPRTAPTTMKLMEFVSPEDIPGMKELSSGYEGFEQFQVRNEAQRQRERANDRQLTAQGLYLNAMGTLIQFNAIVVGIGCATMAAVGDPLLRAATGASLIAHTAAGFLLCLGIRPSRRKEQEAMMQVVSQQRAGVDTFAYYQRGWVASMLALAVSASGIALYLVRFVLPGFF